MEDFLIVILSIPLINKSLNWTSLESIICPLFTLRLKFSFLYGRRWVSSYLCIRLFYCHTDIAWNPYLSITSGCVLNTALYPVEKMEWCVYSLFIKDSELINTHCIGESHTWHANLALNLDSYKWAISSLAAECVQICCLEETHLETIVPSLTLINIGNSVNVIVLTSILLPKLTLPVS